MSGVVSGTSDFGKHVCYVRVELFSVGPIKADVNVEAEDTCTLLVKEKQ